jgi:type II secretory pathway pseudopilin PulG
VREQKPDPFCVEKKITDLLVANGKPAREMPAGYDKSLNPFYDAEVEEDLRIISRFNEAKSDAMQKKLRGKLLQAALKSIPQVDYHPDQIILARASQSQVQIDEPTSPQLQPQTGGMLDMSSSVLQTSAAGDSRSSPKKKGAKKAIKAHRAAAQAQPYAVYMTHSPTKSHSQTVTTKTKKKSGTAGAGEGVFDHVMQPFDQYLQAARAEEERDRREREAQAAAEERRRWQGEGLGLDNEEEEVGVLDRLGMACGDEGLGGLGTSSVYQTGESDLMFDEDAELARAGYGSEGYDDALDGEEDGGEYDE